MYFGIPVDIWNLAMQSWSHHTTQLGDRLRKPTIITIVDYRIPADRPRLWTLDFNRPPPWLPINRFHVPVAHGRGSGRGLTVTSVSNVTNSNESCIGAFLTLHTRQSGAGQRSGRALALVLEGLDPTNDNARGRFIIMHGAWYVSGRRAGNSLGCPAVEQSVNDNLVPYIANGSFIFSHWAPVGPRH